MIRTFLVCTALFTGSVAACMQAQSTDSRVEDLYNQARAFQNHGDIVAAISTYESILKIAPRLAPAYNNLGALYFRQGDYQNAAAMLTRG